MIRHHDRLPAAGYCCNRQDRSGTRVGGQLHEKDLAGLRAFLKEVNEFPASSLVKFAALHIFGVFNAAHGEKRPLMVPEGQLMSKNDTSWSQGVPFMPQPG